MVKKLFTLGKKEDEKFHPRPLQVEIITYLIENKDKTIYQKDIEEKLKISKYRGKKEKKRKRWQNEFFRKIQRADEISFVKFRRNGGVYRRLHYVYRALFCAD